MKLGFIGAGNMAKAIIGGIVSSKQVLGSEIIVANPSDAKLETLKATYQVQTTNDNQAATKVDYLFLCVKPQVIQKVLQEIAEILSSDTVVISIAAGVSIAQIAKNLNEKTKIIRLMPNTPALVLAGMTSLTANQNVTTNEKQVVWNLLSAIGEVVEVKEEMIDAVIAIAGSSPAYVYIMIEAMADAGVSYGLSRDMAYKLAAQAVLGSGKMVLETKINPAALKDMVTSPKGTTIAAVKKLEETGFRSAIMQAMDACFEKSKKM